MHFAEIKLFCTDAQHRFIRILCGVFGTIDKVDKWLEAMNPIRKELKLLNGETGELLNEPR